MKRLRSFENPLIILAVSIMVFFTPREGFSWMHIYGDWSYDGGLYIEQTKDGGYVLTGSTITDGKTDTDTWLLKTDSQGDTSWTKIVDVGALIDDKGFSVHETPDGGFMVFGIIDVTGDYSKDTLYALRTDSDGNTLWIKKYNGRGFSAEPTSDGGYIVIGYHWKLMKLNSSADTLWSISLNHECCFAEETSDGDFIVTGSSLIKIDDSGNLLWESLYPLMNVYGNCVRETSDKRFIVAGHEHYGPDWGDQRLIVLKTDSTGDTLWTYRHPMPTLSAYCVLETAKNEYVICGNQEYSGVAPEGGLLVKLDDYGDTIWTRVYGGTDYNNFNWLTKTVEDGYVLTGTTDAYNALRRDLWLVKTDSAGRAFHKEVSADTIYKPDGYEHLNSMYPKARFVNKSGLEVSSFYCVCEIEPSTYEAYSPESYYLDSVLVQSTLKPDDTITIEFPEWTYHPVPVFDDFKITFYSTKDDDWGSLCKYSIFAGQAGAINENEIPTDKKTWQPLSPLGQEIVLGYAGYPGGFHACVYDASGRKMDEIVAPNKSGVLVWGKCYGPGVYFILAEESKKNPTKVVLIK